MKTYKDILEKVSIYIVGFKDGSEQSEFYGGTAEQAASQFMKEKKKPECKVFAPPKDVGVYEATAGGKAKKKS